MAPSEFWQLSHEEFWKLYDAKQPSKQSGTSLAPDELRELYELIK